MLSYVQSANAGIIFIDVNCVDFSNYPNCTPEYIKAFNNVLKALKTKIRIQTPLLNLNKVQIIKLGIKLKVLYGDTWTWYNLHGMRFV
jgi:7-cyano-7-deazaguanine synthase